MVSNYFWKNKIKTASDNNHRQRELFEFGAIQKILLLFNLENWEDVRCVIDDLGSSGKEIYGWTISLKNKVTPPQDLPPFIRVITSKETDWKGNLIPAIEEDFQRLGYDTLLDLTTIPNNIFDYLLACNHSKLCIGIQEKENKPYDFILLKFPEQNLIETYREIKNFLINNIPTDKK